MALHLDSSNQSSNGAALLNSSFSEGSGSQLALGEDAWLAENEADTKETLAFDAPSPEEATQPNTEVYIGPGKVTHTGEKPTFQESTTQQLAEAPSPEQSEEESQPVSQSYVLLVDSTDTPEAIESIKATIRHMKTLDKRKEVKRAGITSVPYALFRYGYRAETIETETEIDIAAVFKQAHTRVPNARLIISHRLQFTKGIEMSSSSAIIRPEQPLSSRDTFGVIQRTEDVDFTIDLLQNETSCVLNCQIVYDPDSDNCVLFNHTGQDIYLKSLNPADPWRVCVADGWYTTIRPGALGISPSSFGINPRIFMAEMMLLKKQFHICIPNLANHALHKRAIDDATKSTKRRRLDNGEAENTISQSYLAATSGSLVTKPQHHHAARTLDLADGETAIISSVTPKRSKNIATVVESSYKLHRRNGIGETAFSKVFAAWHSEMAKVLVVKIPRYQDTGRLALQVQMWKKEKTILQQLSHVGCFITNPIITTCSNFQIAKYCKTYCL